ncbi:ABC transporter ATP-binding protein [Amycolatopsis pigmentata]|uniref:ABC transporter ATP-binding protein n=1 Tax=Amycolatopsis pigmentata TaxID=450801 RepID=A0ABW5G275_9PSEU
MAEVRIEGIARDYGGTGNPAVRDLTLDIADGCVVTLLGPSGCGKTTTLRMIAGLERPDAGTIRVGDKVVASAEKGTFVPPERRDIGMVFQSYALWPHLTVLENVSYPLRMRRVAKSEMRQRSMKVLEQVGLQDKADSYPSRLSGGQQQRAAIARSLVFDPQLLLMDEPFSNLDARLRERMGEDLRELHAKVGVTTVYVTHDQAEAMVLSDEVVVMHEGRILDQGSPQKISLQPATATVASFLGYNTELRGVVDEVVSQSEDTQVVRASGVDWSGCCLSAPDLVKGDQITLAIRTRVLTMTDKPDESGMSCGWLGVVKARRSVGDRDRVTIACADTTFVLEVDTTCTECRVGTKVNVRAAADKVWAVRSGSDLDGNH